MCVYSETALWEPLACRSACHKECQTRGGGGKERGGGKTSQGEPPTENSFRPPSPRYFCPNPPPLGHFSGLIRESKNFAQATPARNSFLGGVLVNRFSTTPGGSTILDRAPRRLRAAILISVYGERMCYRPRLFFVVFFYAPLCDRKRMVPKRRPSINDQGRTNLENPNLLK